MAAINSLLYDFSGLVTAPGRLARAQASATTADNLNFPAPGLAAKRLGWARQATATNRTPSKLWGFTGGMAPLFARSTNTAQEALALGDGSGAELDIATPDVAKVAGDWGTRSQAVQSGRSVYVTVPGGGGSQPVRIGPEAWNAAGPWYGKAHYAGMPRGLPFSPAVFTTGTPWLPVGYGVAYRVTWHRYDGDGKLLSGPPTSRVVVRNVTGMPSGGTSTVRPRCDMAVPKQWASGFSAGASPADIDTSFFWRLWRTRSFDTSTSDSDEEYFLVREEYVKSSEIASGVITRFDDTPDGFLAVPLNINVANVPDGDLFVASPGLANADNPPPVAFDVAAWASCAWWGNIRSIPNAQVSFLSIGSPGLQDGDTITITTAAGTVVMTARTSPTLTTEFKINTGYATVQWNIEATALDFAVKTNALLRTSGSAVRVHTLLPDSGAPVGTVWIEPMLGFTSSRSGWYRVSPSDALAQVGEMTNGIAFSKPDRADAVCYPSVIRCGPNDAEVLRMVPYRDRLFVFTSRGIYQVTGSTFLDFAVQPYALDLHLLAREAVCYCDDAVYAWCREGIVRLTNAGYELASLPIEPTVRAAVNDATAAGLGVAELAFAVADTQMHRVAFWYPEGVVTRPQCTAAFVFDTRTQAWSRHALPVKTGIASTFFTAGCQRADFRLLFGSAKQATDTEGWLYLQRLTSDADAYKDDQADSAKAATAVASTLALQYQVPDAAGAQHWQQTVLQLDGGEGRPLPTSLSVDWATEETSGNSGSVAVTLRVVRLEPPPPLRRANQLGLTVSSSLAEYFGLVGITQRYRAGSAFARQTAP